MKTIPGFIKTVVIFGGAGLVGFQIARQIAENICPNEIVLCALLKEEAELYAAKLKAEFPHLSSVCYEFGDIYLREELSRKNKNDLTANIQHMNTIFQDTFGPITEDNNNIGQQNLMVKIINKYKPEAIIDCTNTATGISYQDIQTCSQIAKSFKDSLSSVIDNSKQQLFLKETSIIDDEVRKAINDFELIKKTSCEPLETNRQLNNLQMLDLLLISQSMPQLIRHVALLYRALLNSKTRTYIKIGTTGTGGMGINIPFTHGEDKPSAALMTKTAVGFAHTGLLFLLARTPNCPAIKEIKPAAMIGYKKIDFRRINKEKKPASIWETKKEVLENKLILRKKTQDFKNLGDLKLVGIDTGENGYFSRGEYEAITYNNMMEFVTPEEIARIALFELVGINTGKDVISALDSSTISPSYLAGVIRRNCIDGLIKLEKEYDIPSIAVGDLGPPQLSKLLYEAYLLQLKYPTIAEAAQSAVSSEQLASEIESHILNQTSLQNLITSLGLGILLKDGKTILRGPTLNIPESKISNEIYINHDRDIDLWAKQGWVDLRPSNMEKWLKRFNQMLVSKNNSHVDGSALYHRTMYTDEHIRIGEVVGWIFANEMDGYRIK